MKKLLLVIVAIFISISGYSQQPKLSFQVIKKIIDTENQQLPVALLVKGDEAKISKLTRELGGTFKYSHNRISSIMIPIVKVKTLAADAAVERIEDGAPRLQTMGNDTMRYMNHIIDIHNGVGALTQPYTGKGVLLGFIDTGIDYTHPDFQDSTGKTRIKYIWDHLLADSANTPQPYGYGQEFTKNDIDSGRATAHLANNSLHGTCVTGIGGGNGRATGEFTGAAPDAEFAIVSINFNQNDDQFLSSIADAVEYIYAKADAEGKPCIINISAGTYFGSHDGKDLSTQLIDGMITAKNGRSLVCAAGNLGGFPLHTHTTSVAGDTVFTWIKDITTTQPYIEFWGNAASMNSLKFTIGADIVSPYYEYRGNMPYTTIAAQMGVLHTTPLMGLSGNRLATVLSYADIVGGQTGMFFQIIPDSASYNWRVQTTGNGSWDGYAYGWVASNVIPADTVYPAITKYNAPDYTQNMCSGFQCSDKTITVAQYTNMNSYIDYDTTLQTFPTIVGDLHPTSSWGPTRDLRQKPDIAASAEWTFGALIVSSQPWFALNQPYKIPPTGQHIRGNGTSAASAIVSGIVAMYLERYPFANWQDIKTAITSCSIQDSFTGASIQNYKWGHGKTDAFSMITNCGTTSITETTSSAQNIYCIPNPADNVSMLNFSALKSNSTLEIYDNQGRLASRYSLRKGSTSFSVDCSKFARGIYYLRISGSDGAVISGKLVRN